MVRYFSLRLLRYAARPFGSYALPGLNITQVTRAILFACAATVILTLGAAHSIVIRLSGWSSCSGCQNALLTGD